ncbi:MAG: hypothetical protein AAFY37_07565, partial [Pseudomonadota bacterium]
MTVRDLHDENRQHQQMRMPSNSINAFSQPKKGLFARFFLQRLTCVRVQRIDQHFEIGRLAQRESTAFTRQGSLVQ